MPNTRIYKNDDVISAERTFLEALREAYRVTLIYEYYTNQSYARKENLYLVRMISKGDINLETYLSRLEQAFHDFEEQAGKPDIRVAMPNETSLLYTCYRSLCHWTVSTIPCTTQPMERFSIEQPRLWVDLGSEQQSLW